VKWIYSEGTRNPEKISPDNWSMDLFFLGRFYDYRTNFEQYSHWHEYFRKNQPPTLLLWGANDPIFTQEGGRAFQRDVKNAELHMLDTGHFALEDHCDEIAGFVRSFYDRKIAVKRAA
jgi:pimeloyl-ACP methyl ester carboxylesterase